RDLRRFLDDRLRLRKLIEAADVAYDRPQRQIDRWALPTRRNKRVHSKQRAALEEQVRQARESLPKGVAMKVAHFGVGVGRFVELYRGDEVVGLDTTVWVAEQAAFSFEWPRFIVVGPGRRSALPSAAWDLAVVTHLVAAEPPERRRALIQEMSRITRPGGRLVILDDVCGGKGIDTRTLVEEVVDVTGGSVTLVDTAALRYEEAGRIDDGVIALMSVGGRRG
ncbi:MAG: methyltransferase domain-containing protein, partial [Acidimicrobiia bacterium]